MQAQGINWVQYVTGILVLALFVSLCAGWYAPDVKVTTEKVEVIQTNATYDFDEFSEKLEGIQTTLDEEDIWKDEAIALATTEWERRDYKYIYRFFIDNETEIDDKDDIDKVVIKDSEVTSFDVEDKDAVVIQKLKVYYEDLDGNDVKVYLIVTTEIEEGEVEDQWFEFD